MDGAAQIDNLEKLNLNLKSRITRTVLMSFAVTANKISIRIRERPSRASSIVGAPPIATQHFRGHKVSLFSYEVSASRCCSRCFVWFIWFNDRAGLFVNSNAGWSAKRPIPPEANVKYNYCNLLSFLNLDYSLILRIEVQPCWGNSLARESNIKRNRL